VLDYINGKGQGIGQFVNRLIREAGFMVDQRERVGGFTRTRTLVADQWYACKADRNLQYPYGDFRPAVLELWRTE
jgi:hypothetical protein